MQCLKIHYFNYPNLNILNYVNLFTLTAKIKNLLFEANEALVNI